MRLSSLISAKRRNGQRYPGMHFPAPACRCFLSVAILYYQARRKRGGWMIVFLFIAVYCTLSLRLAWIDFRTGYLPDRYTCPLLWCGLGFHLFQSRGYLEHAVAGAMAGYFFFWGVYWLFRKWRGYEGLGYGDIKLLAALGAWHGWEEISLIVALAAAGGCVALLLNAAVFPQQKIFKTPQPFGPFLVAAGFGVSWQTFLTPVTESLKLLL